MANGFKNFSPSVHHGPIYSLDYDKDGSLWIPAAGGQFIYPVGTWTDTRAAAGDYYKALTAAANSPIAVVNLTAAFEKFGTDPVWSIPGRLTGAVPVADGTAPAGTQNSGLLGNGRVKVNDGFGGHILRGFMLTGYDVVYSLGTANLTTHNGTCYRVTYDLTHTAGTVVTTDAAQGLGTATNANVLLSSSTIVAPFVIGNNASAFGLSALADYLEITIVNPGTSVYHLYGVRLYFSYCIL